MLEIQPGTVILLDACSLINLYATRYLSEILATLPVRCVISDVVLRESHFVRRGGNGNDANERESLELQSVVDAGLLEIIVSTDEEELLTFIDLATLIDEGEAMSMALAMHRGWFVMTDDRKARRLLIEREIACFSSLEFVRNWSVAARLAPSEVQAALRAIEQRARWVPWRTHPLAEWWKRSIESGE